MPTGRQYADEVLRRANVTPQPGYIYGSSGQIWRNCDQEALIKKYNSDPVKYSDYKLSAQLGGKWIGHIVYDCSGLTSRSGATLGLKYAHGSNSSYRNDCSHKGVLTKGMELPVGAWVYTGKSSTSHPHIGTYTGDGWVTEAQGTKAGVTRSKLTDKKWTYWGLGKGITFDFIPGGGKAETETGIGEAVSDKKKSHPTLKRGSKGASVKELQQLLIKKGYKLPKYGADGDFGNETLEAVKKFQKDKGLTVDGIVGAQTWSKLLS